MYPFINPSLPSPVTLAMEERDFFMNFLFVKIILIYIDIYYLQYRYNSIFIIWRDKDGNKRKHLRNNKRSTK